MAVYRSCEISKRFSDLSSSSSSENEDSDYDDVLSSSASQYSTTGGKSNSKQSTTVQRLPTRRPDPNVSNRNALLARENRRKKKEYLETLEKKLDTMKLANKKLHKTLKKHMKLVKKLEHEKQYYKGLVANRTDLLDLVSVLNGKVPPTIGGTYSPKQSSCSPTDSNRSSSSNFGDQPLTYELHHDNDDNDNDSDYAPMFDGETNWDQLLGLSSDPLPDEDGGFLPLSHSRNSGIINDEHNYYQSPPDSGVCLHSVEGTISLENCISCEKRSCLPLPDQLFVSG